MKTFELGEIFLKTLQSKNRFANSKMQTQAMVEEEVRFTVNGKEVVVGKEVGPQTRLARFRRVS